MRCVEVLQLLKACARCGLWLAPEEFPLRRKDGTKRYGHCRACKAAYQKAWYERNRTTHGRNVAVLRRERRERNRAIVAAAKQRPCLDCGHEYPAVVMDFDHVRGEKLGDISTLKQHAPTGALIAEIAKCDVVCSNCHRLRTAQRRHR